MWLGSGIAVAVVKASGYSSDLTPSLGTSICQGCSPKKTNNDNKMKDAVVEGNPNTLRVNLPIWFLQKLDGSMVDDYGVLEI